MFTGLIEEVGMVMAIEAVPHGSRLCIHSGRLCDDLAEGASIAVDGVCLTALGVGRNEFLTDISPETIARTNLSFFKIGTPVNLERPLAVGQRLGGHFVQGHVDGISRAVETHPEGEFTRMRFTIPSGLAGYLVEKGSVALNGVSLTVASLQEETFDVQLVPHTIERTNLTAERRAEAINMEVDILGKYVARLLQGRDESEESRSVLEGASVDPGQFIRLPGDES